MCKKSEAVRIARKNKGFKDLSKHRIKNWQMAIFKNKKIKRDDKLVTIDYRTIFDENIPAKSAVISLHESVLNRTHYEF